MCELYHDILSKLNTGLEIELDTIMHGKCIMDYIMIKHIKQVENTM